MSGELLFERPEGPFEVKKLQVLTFFFQDFVLGPRGGTCTVHGAPCTVYRGKAPVHAVYRGNLVSLHGGPCTVRCDERLHGTLDHARCTVTGKFTARSTVHGGTRVTTD